MALFRSDVINKEFIEKVLRKNEVKNIYYFEIQNLLHDIFEKKISGNQSCKCKYTDRSR